MQRVGFGNEQVFKRFATANDLSRTQGESAHQLIVSGTVDNIDVEVTRMAVVEGRWRIRLVAELEKPLSSAFLVRPTPSTKGASQAGQDDSGQPSMSNLTERFPTLAAKEIEVFADDAAVIEGLLSDSAIKARLTELITPQSGCEITHERVVMVHRGAFQDGLDAPFEQLLEVARTIQAKG